MGKLHQNHMRETTNKPVLPFTQYAHRTRSFPVVITASHIVQVQVAHWTWTVSYVWWGFLWGTVFFSPTYLAFCFFNHLLIWITSCLPSRNFADCLWLLNCVLTQSVESHPVSVITSETRVHNNYDDGLNLLIRPSVDLMLSSSSQHAIGSLLLIVRNFSSLPHHQKHKRTKRTIMETPQWTIRSEYTSLLFPCSHSWLKYLLYYFNIFVLNKTTENHVHSVSI